MTKDTQQTRYIKPMPVQCWASIVDGVPTPDQHRAMHRVCRLFLALVRSQKKASQLNILPLASMSCNISHINWWQDPSAVGSVNQYKEIMTEKCPPQCQFLFYIAAADILFLMDSSQKLIRLSEISREQPYQIWMQSNQWFISYRAHKL